MRFRFDPAAVDAMTTLIVAGDAEALAAWPCRVDVAKYDLEPGQGVYIGGESILLRRGDGDQVPMFAGQSWELREVHDDADRSRLAQSAEQLELGPN